MRTILIAALMAGILGTSAQAATRHKHKRVQAPPPASVQFQQAPVANRPIWSNPTDCFTDEGYGRFWPCGAGRSN